MTKLLTKFFKNKKLRQALNQVYVISKIFVTFLILYSSIRIFVLSAKGFVANCTLHQVHII